MPLDDLRVMAFSDASQHNAAQSGTQGGYIVAFSEIIATYAFKKFITYIVPVKFAPEGLGQLLSTEYKFAVSFLILVLVLLVRPTGIFRGRVL